MRIFLIAGALTFSSFLLFSEAVFSQGNAECPAAIFISSNGEREVVWREGDKEVKEGQFWVKGHWEKKINAEGYEWKSGSWEKIRSGWVFIQEVGAGKSRWIMCSEIQ